MQSRRDQVDAYLHLQARLVSALVGGQPDPVESPTRRDRTSFVTSLVVGVLAVAVALVVGLVFGPQKLTAADGTVLLDDRTGHRYLLSKGVVYPVSNLTSARMLTGRPVTVRRTDHDLLVELPRGPAVGLRDAPDAVPEAAALNRGTWQACTVGSAASPRVDLMLGALPEASVLEPDLAVLVSDGTSDALLWRGRRLRLPRVQVASILGYGGVSRVAVAPRWLALVPRGPDLVAPVLPGRGGAGAPIGRRPTRIGDLFRVAGTDGPSTYYLSVGGGLAPITALDALLVQADPVAAAAGQADPASLTTAELATARPATLARSGDLPTRPPRLTGLPENRVLCVRQGASGGDRAPRLVLAPGRALTAASGAADAAAGGGPSVVVRVQPGYGSLARAGTASGGRAVLVADDGIAYPVPDVRVLGYKGEHVITGLEALVDLVPGGQPLAAARLLPPAAGPAGGTGNTG